MAASPCSLFPQRKRTYSKYIGFCICIAACAASAAAAPIRFTFSLTGGGSLGGVTFAATQVEVDIDSDTTKIINPFGDPGLFGTIANAKGFYAICGTASGSITEQFLDVIDTTRGGAAFGGGYFGGGPGDFLDISSPVFENYRLQTAFLSPVIPSAAFLNRRGFATDEGQLILTSASDIVFSATITPEPGTFAMLASGAAAAAVYSQLRKR